MPLRQTELIDRDSRLYHREPRVYWRCPRRSLRTCIASRRLKTIAELSQDQPVVHAAQRGRCLKTLFSSKALSEGVWALLGKPCGSKSNEVGQSQDGEVWDSDGLELLESLRLRLAFCGHPTQEAPVQFPQLLRSPKNRTSLEIRAGLHIK